MQTSTPARSIRLTGASNFRDLGGYAGQDGRTLKWRRLFRSDHLGALNDADVALLTALGLERACDFRGGDERLQQVCAIPGLPVHSLAIDPTVVQAMKALMQSGGSLTASDTVRLMQDTYRAFVHHHAHRFAELFVHLLRGDGPLVFHCTAGKDRTGFAAALVLMSLGVSRTVAMQDYLLTNALYRMPDAASSSLPQEALQVLWRVQEGFLNAAFEAVDADFGGLSHYLDTALGVGRRERERLAELYLQP